MTDLTERIERIARVPVLLVGTDYDGTLSAIVDDPRDARAHPEALAALGTLARLPRTHVVVISGRSLRDLGELAPFPDEVHLVGSHGGELDADFPERLPPTKAALRREVRDGLREIAEGDPGFLVEEKPGSLAFHYRNASPDAAREAVAEIERSLGRRDDVFVKRGKMVIELAVVETHKGHALETIRRRVGASAVAYFGDDVTDEDVFSGLAGPDVGVKVGEGETCAEFRVGSPDDVARILAQLCDRRAARTGAPRSRPTE